jgi:hypothetical protein
VEEDEVVMVMELAVWDTDMEAAIGDGDGSGLLEQCERSTVGCSIGAGGGRVRKRQIKDR